MGNNKYLFYKFIFYFKNIRSKNLKKDTKNSTPLYIYPNDNIFYDFSLYNHLFFLHRFKFDLASQRHRWQILELQEEHQLSDSDVTLLWESNAFQKNKEGNYGLISESWALHFGRTFLIYGVLSAIYYIIYEIRSFSLNINCTNQLNTSYFMVTSVLFIALWLNNKYMLKPASILKDKGCKINKFYPPTSTFETW